MKSLVLIISCLLLMLLAPIKQLGTDAYAVQYVSSMQAEEVNQNPTHQQTQEDAIYDNDVVTLLSTYDCGNNDFIPCRINQWGQQLRMLTLRFQLRQYSLVLLVKQQTHLLAAHLTTLINHISQFYSSIHSLCWQYAADCYVFAFRQILI